MRFTLCDRNSVNSYGFRTDTDGMDLERFRSNPVMFYSHDSDHVIGRWKDIELTDGCLTAEAEFDMDDPVAAEIAGKVERGFLKGASIGMIIRDMHEIDGVLTATRTELLEASVCAIPSDKNAIVLYDDNHTKLSFDEVKLQFQTNTDNMEDLQNLQNQVTELTATIGERDKQIADMQERIAELEACNTELRNAIESAVSDAIDVYLNHAVEDGKIDANERDSYRKLAESDFETVKSIIDARPKRPSASLAQQLKATSTAPTWDELDRSGELLKLKQEDPAEFQRLYEQKFGKKNA